jgi:hypothetical protein
MNDPDDTATSDKQRWPDGAPVTPWADPWHDVAADIRQTMADIHDSGNGTLGDF